MSTTLTLSIPHNVIRAALLAVPKEDIRYYLKGMCIDASQSAAGKLYLTTTDGHRMMVFDAAPFARDENGDAAPVLAMAWEQIIIPREMLDAVKPAKAGRAELNIKVQVSPDSVTVTGATTATGKPIDGEWPYYRHVLPQTLSGETAQFNPDYLADLGKAQALLNGKRKGTYLRLAHNGNGPALAELSDAAFAIVMPQRADKADIPTGLPAWFK